MPSTLLGLQLQATARPDEKNKLSALLIWALAIFPLTPTLSPMERVGVRGVI